MPAPFLVGGVGLAGAVGGVLIDAVAARTPPVRSRAPEEASPAPEGPGDDGAVPGAAADPTEPDAVEGRPGPGTLERPAGPETTEGPAEPDEVEPPAPLERVTAAVAGGALCALAAWRLGAVPELAAYAVCFVGLVGLCVADIRVGLVPRRILYPLAALVALALLCASAAAGDWRAVGWAAAGGAGSFVFLFCVWWFVPRGIGFGDVRLAGLTGAAAGWFGIWHAYLAMATAFAVGLVYGVVVAVARGTGRKTRIPFAPALAAGCVVAVLWGSAVLAHWRPGAS